MLLKSTINSTHTHVKVIVIFAIGLSDRLRGKGYESFINAIKSPKTKIAYAQSLRRYLNHRKLTDVDNLLLDQNPRVIESQIVDHVMTLRSEGVSYATICYLLAPILTFYPLNDVVLNRKKVSRYFGEYKKVVKDRAYTAEEIYKALQTADLRMKVIFLLMSSGAQRIGSLADLTLENLTFIEPYGIFKVTLESKPPLFFIFNSTKQKAT